MEGLLPARIRRGHLDANVESHESASPRVPACACMSLHLSDFCCMGSQWCICAILLCYCLPPPSSFSPSKISFTGRPRPHLRADNQRHPGRNPIGRHEVSGTQPVRHLAPLQVLLVTPLSSVCAQKHTHAHTLSLFSLLSLSLSHVGFHGLVPSSQHTCNPPSARNCYAMVRR